MMKKSYQRPEKDEMFEELKGFSEELSAVHKHQSSNMEDMRVVNLVGDIEILLPKLHTLKLHMFRL